MSVLTDVLFEAHTSQQAWEIGVILGSDLFDLEARRMVEVIGSHAADVAV